MLSSKIKILYKKIGFLFTATVIIPTLLSLIYFGFIASDVYLSESRFVVRSPDRPAASGIGLLLKGAGFSNAGEESYSVQDYIESRDALQMLNRNGMFADAYSASNIDVFHRFGAAGGSTSFESLYRYFTDVVSAKHDSSTSITTLIVRGYTPQSASEINGRLIQQAEALVNRLNERGRSDLIHYGEVEVAAAESRARGAANALAVYRNDARVIDPERQAQVQVALVSKLQDQLIATQGQLAQLQAFTPDNPQVAVLRQRTSSLQADIQRETGRVAGGGATSFAGKASQYQRLQFENEFAQRALASALASFEEARNEARRKQIYVERIVEPNLPDKALEPRRVRGIFATFVLGLFAWGILSMLLAGLREHQN
jgi:capsular polysaccharide transport system permease protein